MIGRAAEFGRPDHQRVVEHAALLQVEHEPGDRLIDVLRQPGMVQHVAVRVPVVRRAGVDQLDEADATLGQTPGDQALPAKAGIPAALQAVELERGVGLLRQVERLRGPRAACRRRSRRIGSGLPGRRRRAGWSRCRRLAVGDQLEFELLQVLARTRRSMLAIGVGPGDQVRALVAAGQEVGAPGLRARVGRSRSDDHERRQVAVLGAQAVADPGADARPGKRERTGVHAERGFVVVGVVRLHRADHAHVVHDAATVAETDR